MVNKKSPNGNDSYRCASRINDVSISNSQQKVSAEENTEFDFGIVANNKNKKVPETKQKILKVKLSTESF